ncbi:hypothetical protein [Desertibaculum subflavum]|uniref:hypothetical protein n=1 Tax=Desertibaculum subflavum TaxID=2268458 RepID=UPI000E66FB3F
MTGALKLAGLAVALWAGFAALPQPAAADSFSFSYSTGRPYYGHRHYGHRHYGPPRHAYYYYGPRFYYPPPPPRVVYYYPPPPPVFYVPVPRGPAVAAHPTSPVFQTPQGQHCREYQANLNIGGAVQPSYGTACLQPDGTWRLMN